MNILFAGYLHYYADPAAGYSLEYNDLAASLADMGHEVVFIGHDQPAFMRRFENAARSIQPDLIIYNPARDEMDWPTFQAMPFPKALLYSDDNWRRDYGLSIADNADYILTTTPDGAAVYGDKHVPFQWGVRVSRYEKLPAVPRDVKLMFLGMNHSSRADMAERLAAAGIEPECYGRGWERPLNGDKLPDLLARARIGLCPTQTSQGGMRQFKARLFETAAAGALLLTEYVDGLDAYFTHNVDAVFWTDFDGMVEAALYYLARPAELNAIAARGRERALREHDYARRWMPLLERVTEDTRMRGL